MSEALSRRDWFRLRLPHVNKMLTQDDVPSSDEGATTLNPIPHPPNHDGMDLQSLPPMSEAELTWDEVRQLMQDIDRLAKNIVLMLRTGERSSASGTGLSTSEQLSQALSALESAQVGRVQVRYRWNNAQWIDTLERRDTAVRLVRIKHPESLSR